VPPIYREVGIIPVQPPEFPIRGNMPDGGTSAFVQVKWFKRNNGEWRRATHSNVTSSNVAVEMWVPFFNGALQDGVGVIADPYAELGTPPD